jgi:mRNA-degrading endonuclease toxin of MazEF toxin-antitoxin module
MKQWDIFDFSFEHPVGTHPALILSPDDVTANQAITRINVLVVTTVRADYRSGRFDVLLNGADGLDHLSRVRVLPIFQVDRSYFGRRRGSLSSTRQKIVATKIREALCLG